MHLEIVGSVIQTSIKVVHPVIEFQQMLIPNTIAIFGTVKMAMKKRDRVV